MSHLDTLRVAIPGLKRRGGSLLAGWIAYILPGRVVARLFSAIVSDPGMADVGANYRPTESADVSFGVMLAVVDAGVVRAIGLPGISSNSPAVVHLTTPISLFHLIYDIVLGILFARVREM